MAEIEPSTTVSDVADVPGKDIVLDTVNAADGEYSDADYKRILRKIDIVLLPLMWFCYGTQQADKTSISTQATFGMIEDTHLVGQQYSCTSFSSCKGSKGTVNQETPPCTC